MKHETWAQSDLGQLYMHRQHDIDESEIIRAYGIIYGYPKCCIDFVADGMYDGLSIDFWMETDIEEYQDTKIFVEASLEGPSDNFGFYPCPDCMVKYAKKGFRSFMGRESMEISFDTSKDV